MNLQLQPFTVGALIALIVFMVVIILAILHTLNPIVAGLFAALALARLL